jgi:hypothetical protein
LADHVGLARSIADQPAELSEFAPLIDRWNRMACRQHHEFLAPAVEERIGSDDKRSGLQIDKGDVGALEISFGAGL